MDDEFAGQVDIKHWYFMSPKSSENKESWDVIEAKNPDEASQLALKKKRGGFWIIKSMNRL